MYHSLQESLKDEKFCSELDQFNLDYCYSVLYIDSRTELTNLLRNEIEIDPLDYASEIVSGMVPRDQRTISIPKNITAIGYEAFKDCNSLTSITIPDSVTSIGTSAFDDCDGLTSIIIPDSVTSIDGWAFHYCDNLTSVTIGNSVTSIGYVAFRHCRRLRSVTIGNSVTSIGEDAFYNCRSLTSVYITDIASWCNISFSNYVANPLCYAKNLYLNNKLVTELTIPNSVTSIGNYAFHGYSGLTSITIPDSVTSIGSYAFRCCTNLTSITIPEGITSIGYAAFEGCRKLTSITYQGTKKEASKCGLTNKRWRSRSNIETIRCIDGEIRLTL